uniref:Ig-like domain-containing protein n=1 Tax=Oncorhynchus mykiss TaxID=8022 RepID=A0A8C7T6U7_ONCMY
IIKICLRWSILRTVYLLKTEVAKQDLPTCGHSFKNVVKLPCPTHEEDINMFWYKQMVGQKPQTIVTMTKYDMPVWHKDFNHSCVNVEKADADGMYRLAITNTDPTDEAVYYCAVRTAYEVNFINGTLLLLKAHYHTVVQRPVSDPVHPGHYVTLQCTVFSETCTGEHSVYWFRARSGESHPGFIYTSGNKSDECKKSPETPSTTHSCVYSLSKNNLSPSHAGTYYCAVATCGEILFGNGTKLDVKESLKNIIIILKNVSVTCLIVLSTLLF